MTKVTRLTLDEEGGLDRRRIHLREISGDMDAPLDTVGQDLRAARLRRGDDLATVSRALKIRKDHLEALEEDRIEALPGRTYAVGFIRSYADYLGLDAVQCVERFKAEIAGRSDSSTPAITVIDEDAERRMPHGWKIIAGVVLLLVIYGAYQLAASVDRQLSEQTVAPPPPPPMQKPVATRPGPPVHLAVTGPLTSPLDTSLPFSETVSGNHQSAPSSTGAAGLTNPMQATTTTTGVQSSGVSEPLPQGVAYGVNNKGSRVMLRMRDTARVLVQGPDGTVYINRTLKPGDSYQLPNLVGLTLTTSNAGAVEVDLDGQPVGLAGRSQETGEALSLDPQSIMDRYNGNHG